MEEKNIILALFHQLPLHRITNVTAEFHGCYGCQRYFLPGEAVYGFSFSDFDYLLHEECGEMDREIRHPLHPSHPLKLTVDLDNTPCCVCGDSLSYSRVYICGEGCEFQIHMVCAGDGVAVEGELMEHTQHDLRLLRRKNSSFDCDACGIIKKGNSYVCTKCDYLIHESCASLPTNYNFHHHHHSLSLAFYPPYEYIKNQYTCDICNGTLRLRHWIYHCALCRYVVHLNCATNASNTVDDENADDGEVDFLITPVHDLYEEMIRPFVLKGRGEISFPHYNEVITTYEFHKEGHPLRFTTVSSSSRDDHDEEGDSGDDDDDVERLTCDGCALAIDEKTGYMSCGECKYFLHLACFNLPRQLPSHPFHHINHKLSLQSVGEMLDWARCNICKLFTNGLFYSCAVTECSFKIDIKCASLPNIIRHSGHRKLGHFVKLVIHNHETSFCNACYRQIGVHKIYYKCDSCRFCVCIRCVLLPASNKHRLEKHTMPLTYDANVDHPSEFYCSNCERQMNPKRWMYHCRECDQSIHPKCFPAASGKLRNINFGRQEYHANQHPHHSLRFQIISKKKRCDVFHDDVYDWPGFQCTSCNFAMCLWNHIDELLFS